MSTITLDKVKIGVSYTVNNIDSLCKNKQRLLELGFTKNTGILPLRKSPSGDPTAYLVKGCVIALREADARKINVDIIKR